MKKLQANPGLFSITYLVMDTAGDQEPHIMRYAIIMARSLPR